MRLRHVTRICSLLFFGVLVISVAGCQGSSNSGAAAGGGGGGGAAAATLLGGGATGAAALDTGGDGTLTEAEATTGGAITAAEFALLDADSSGTVTLAELITATLSSGTYTASALTGGQMYDKWWVVAGLTAPATDHPLYASGTGAKTGSTTWRCKECHGWDYIGNLGRYATGSHATGFAGIVPLVTDVTDFDVFDRIKTNHGFGAAPAGLDDVQIGDLTEFVTAGAAGSGAIDTSGIIPVSSGAFAGSSANGATLFAGAALCSGCHGADGLTMGGVLPEYFEHGPGFLSNDNPEEFQHKVRYGHPGSIMTGRAADLTTVEVGDLGVFAQSLPQSLLLPSGTSDVLNGGQLYDKWWVVNSATPPATDHPEWAAQATNTRAGSDTWRCKECHGWDYIGNLGRYGTGSHLTGFAGLFGSTLTGQEIYNKIWTDHQYGNKLTDQEILDLVGFVQAGQLDITTILASTSGPFIGSLANGTTLFAGACAGCHGATGQTVPPVGSTDTGFTNIPGFLSNDNPEEFQHKVAYGHPGSIMPGQALAYTDAQIGELGVFAQTLPQTAP